LSALGGNKAGVSSNLSTSSFGSRIDAISTDSPYKPSKSRSSGTGLPHLFELYEQLLAQRGDEFDFSLRTSQFGTTFKIKFRALIMSGSASELAAAGGFHDGVHGSPSPPANLGASPGSHRVAPHTHIGAMSSSGDPSTDGEQIRALRSDSSGKATSRQPAGTPPHILCFRRFVIYDVLHNRHDSSCGRQCGDP
jgi:hypothetical protein